MKIKNAVATMAIGKYSRILISLLVNVILSRLLSPEDYGVVAVVTVFTTFFASLSDIGLSTAIIQKKELDNDDVNSIFSLSVYYSFVLAIIFIILAWPISQFYGSDVYLNICLILSISLFFDALNTVPNGIMNRDKQFKKIAFRTVIVYVCSSCVAIYLAFKGWSYYSLVVQSVIYSIVTFIWNYCTTKPKFRLKIRIDSINKIKGYSSYQFAFNILVYFARNLDNLLTGKFFGSAELGYYNKAYSLMLYPINNITNVIAPVLHPVLSDYQDEKEKIYKSFINIVKILFIIGALVSGICFIASKEIIIIAFGNQWGQSVDCFKALSFAILFQMINGTTGAIYQSLGNTKLLFINGAINSTITVVFILLGIVIGGNIVNLSVFVALAYSIQCVFSFWHLVHYGFKYAFTRLIKDMRIEIGMMIVLVFAIFAYRVSVDSLVISLLIKTVYIGVIGVLYLLLTGELKRLLSIVKK